MGIASFRVIGCDNLLNLFHAPDVHFYVNFDDYVKNNPDNIQADKLAEIKNNSIPGAITIDELRLRVFDIIFERNFTTCVENASNSLYLEASLFNCIKMLFPPTSFGEGAYPEFEAKNVSLLESTQVSSPGSNSKWNIFIVNYTIIPAKRFLYSLVLNIAIISLKISGLFTNLSPEQIDEQKFYKL